MKIIGPRTIPTLSGILLSFIAGMIVVHIGVFPYPQVRNALKTLEAIVDHYASRSKPYAGKWIGSADIPASQASDRRWTVVDPSFDRLPVYVFGGMNHFRDLCPDLGCLAVEYGSDGAVTRTWPYRPAEIFAADMTAGEFPREYIGFDPVRNVHPMGIEALGDGSLITTFQSEGEGIFPFGMGVSRVSEDGAPVWTRFDYTHHWPRLDSEGRPMVAGMAIGEGDIRLSIGEEPDEHRTTIRCGNGQHHVDLVNTLGPNGEIVESIDLLELFRSSNWAMLLRETTNGCDPLHLNFIDEIGPDAGPGIAPGDLIVSFRNISRFAVLDRDTRTIKRVVAGGFVQQHSVHHLAGTRFLVFDNHGGDEFGPPSRILEIDIAAGTERRVFPIDTTPEPWRFVFTNKAGHIDISPDRRRVIASFTHEGLAFEVDIATGRLITVYDHLHDLTGIGGRPDPDADKATRFSLYGINYARPDRR